MKKFILVILLLFLTFPAIGNAAYLIRLKNGGEFKTFRYWSEGDQIKFYVPGGIVGISKDSVRKIEKIELLYEERTASPEKKPAPVPVKTESETDVNVKDAPDADAKEKEAPAAGAAKKIETKSKEIDVEYYQRINEELWDKYRKAKERYDQSKLDRDELIGNEAKKEISEALDKLTELSGELKKKNKDILPDWWQDKP